VQVLLSTLRLTETGGSETYLLTVAEQLQRLGHDVTVWSPQQGRLAEESRERRIAVARAETDLPSVPDALLVQDRVVSYSLAERYPETPQVFVAQSEIWDTQLPPPVAGMVQAVVVLNERMRRLAEALAEAPRVVRLRQPVDLKRFFPLAPIRARAERVLLVGNYLRGHRLELMVEACRRAGLVCDQRAGADSRVDDLVGAIMEADVVVGKARAIVEAMACGRAAYVYDVWGCDGWVTPDRYEALEADNFGGRTDPTAVTLDRIVSDLEGYDPQMGPANFELVCANHGAAKHAEALLGLFRELQPVRSRPRAALNALARAELRHVEMEGWVRAASEARDDAVRRAEAAESRAEAAEARTVDAETRLSAAHVWREDFERTGSYRLARVISRGVRALRRIRGRTLEPAEASRTHRPAAWFPPIEPRTSSSVPAWRSPTTPRSGRTWCFIPEFGSAPGARSRTPASSAGRRSRTRPRACPTPASSYWRTGSRFAPAALCSPGRGSARVR
jgi:hypothetical protein